MNDEIVTKLHEMHKRSPGSMLFEADYDDNLDAEELDPDDRRISPEGANDRSSRGTETRTPLKHIPKHPSRSKSGREDREDREDRDQPVVEKPKPQVIKKSDNPLDNEYATAYHIGDKIVLHISDTNNYNGKIEGYDKNGFYRVKWDSGVTTNGFTDESLTQFVASVSESKSKICKCGSNKFIVESLDVVCDVCGRKILSESSERSEWYQLSHMYPNSKEFKDCEANSGDIRDLIEYLDAHDLGYCTYQNKKDHGCTIFYDEESKSVNAGHEMIKRGIRSVLKPVSTIDNSGNDMGE